MGEPLRETPYIGDSLFNLAAEHEFLGKLEELRRFCTDAKDGELLIELLTVRVFAINFATYFALDDEDVDFRTAIMNSVYHSLQSLLDRMNKGILYESIMRTVGLYSELAFKKAQESLGGIELLVGWSFEQYCQGYSEEVKVTSPNRELTAWAARMFKDIVAEADKLIQDYLYAQNIDIHELYDFTNLDVNMVCEIHYHQDDEASVFIESNNSGAAKFQAEVCSFILLTLRQMVNIDDDKIMLPLAQLLEEIGPHLADIGADSFSNGTRLVTYNGKPGRKRFISNTQINFPQDTIKFKHSAKGFGWFGRGIGYYAPSSVIVLLQHLAIKHSNDPLRLEILAKAAQGCAEVYTTRQLKLNNQSQMFLSIALYAFTR